jgi:hypothetical protein
MRKVKVSLKKTARKAVATPSRHYPHNHHLYPGYHKDDLHFAVFFCAVGLGVLFYLLMMF